MFITYFNRDTGIISACGEMQPDMYEELKDKIGNHICAQSEPYLHYVENDEIKTFPPRTNIWCEFDVKNKVWVDVRDIADVKLEVAAIRNAKLSVCDWTQLSDIPAETKALWEPYRQALRDITQQAGYPYNVVWPTSPTA